MDLSFPYLLNNYEAKDQKVVTVDFLIFWQNKKMLHPHVTDAQNVLELGVNTPAVFVDRGWVEEADSNLAHNTHKPAAFKDVDDEIFKNHGDDLEEQCICGGNPQQVKLPFMVEKQVKKWSVDLFMNMMMNLQKKSQVLLWLTVEYQKMCHNVFCPHSHTSCC